nr:MAG TPA: hypothetical protein [Caudoviricetes sp.]
MTLVRVGLGRRGPNFKLRSRRTLEYCKPKIIVSVTRTFPRSPAKTKNFDGPEEKVRPPELSTERSLG